jgi:hypothetical protein
VNIIALYGPPAAGKLTVANELVAGTGYTRFDNHRVVDLVVDFFDFETPAHMRLLRRIQLAFFEEAAAGGIPGVVLTFLYQSGKDHEFLGRLAGIAEESGGRACFVLLHCDPAELMRRVDSESRRGTMKLTSPEILESILPRYGDGAEVPFGERFTVHSDRMSPVEAAEAILEHFGLR